MSDYSDGSRVACHKFHWFSARKNVVPFQSPPMVCLPPNQILQEESTTLLKASQQDTAGPRGTQLMENRDPLIFIYSSIGEQQQSHSWWNSETFHQQGLHWLMETVCFRDSKSLKRCRKWVAAPWQLFFPTCPHGQSLAAKPHRICSHGQVEMATWRAIGYLQLGTGAFAQLCRSSSALCGYPQGKYIKYIQIYPRIAMQQGGLKNPSDINHDTKLQDSQRT